MAGGRLRAVIAVWVGLAAVMMAVTGTLAEAPANDAFERTWERTDRPVAAGETVRTWMWGPEAFTGAMVEPYQESPDGQRTVQYFDKSRMEITFPDAEDDPVWYVTNGLLVVELITGRMQTGHNTFEQRSPAEVSVAGDAESGTGPTYATFAGVLDAPPAEPGKLYTQRLNRDGSTGNRLNLVLHDVAAAVVDEETNHAIAAPFWEFMNSSGVVLQDGAYTTAPLFENPYFATGRPITEAYWSSVQVGGSLQDVLIQCFERRCLTYTPGNDPQWQVEAGNVGLHYYAWRYDGTPPQPPPPSAEVSAFPDGIWLVGEDIQPGIYRNNDSSATCYWARLSGLGGTVGEIITNGISDVRMIVEIAATDRAFESVSCDGWSSDLSPITASPTAAFGDGTYIVGPEIAPGSWRSSGSDENCYWERLSGFSGELHDIIANEFITAEDADQPRLVTIADSDVGFLTQGCGVWTLLDS